MSLEKDFAGIIIFDFCNLNLQENSTGNCFGCDYMEHDSGDCDMCDSCDHGW